MHCNTLPKHQEELNKLNDLAQVLGSDFNLQVQSQRQVDADIEESTRCVAVCCSVLQRVAACCSVL